MLPVSDPNPLKGPRVPDEQGHFRRNSIGIQSIIADHPLLSTNKGKDTGMEKNIAQPESYLKISHQVNIIMSNVGEIF